MDEKSSASSPDHRRLKCDLTRSATVTIEPGRASMNNIIYRSSEGRRRILPLRFL